MELIKRLQLAFPDLEFDSEEWEDSQSYFDFLNSEERAQLNYDRNLHPIYSHQSRSRVLDRTILNQSNDPFDANLSPSKIHWQNHTSGTSGRPLALLYSSRFYFFGLFESLKKALRFRGLDLNEGQEQIHIYLTDNPNHSFCIHLDPRNENLVYLTLPMRGTDAVSWKIVRQLLEKLNPHTISSKPSLYSLLLAQKIKWELTNLQALISSGARLSDDLLQRLSEKFQVPVLNCYITSELGQLAIACTRGKMHLLTQHHDFHVQSQDGGIKTSGVGDLLVSSDLNDCMPLSFYAIGDHVNLQLSGCLCGQSGPYLLEFSGRSVPLFETTSGQKFSPTRWMTLLKQFPQILEFQMTQYPNLSLNLKIESNQPLTKFKAELQSFLTDGLEESLIMEITETKFMRNEKIQRFRREIK